MKRRLAYVATAAVVAAGPTGLLVWLERPSPAVRAARINFTNLRVGMTADEAAAAMGVPPTYKKALYGSWSADRSQFDSVFTRSGDPLPPGVARCDYYHWNLSQDGIWLQEQCHVMAYVEGGRLVHFSYSEQHDSVARRGASAIGQRLGIDTSWATRAYGVSSHPR